MWLDTFGLAIGDALQLCQDEFFDQGDRGEEVGSSRGDLQARYMLSYLESAGSTHHAMQCYCGQERSAKEQEVASNFQMT